MRLMPHFLVNFMLTLHHCKFLPKLSAASWFRNQCIFYNVKCCQETQLQINLNYFTNESLKYFLGTSNLSRTNGPMARFYTPGTYTVIRFYFYVEIYVLTISISFQLQLENKRLKREIDFLKAVDSVSSGFPNRVMANSLIDLSN